MTDPEHNASSPRATAGAPSPPAVVADEPYSIFDHRQRALIVFTASVAATFSGFASNIYFPALPTIATDFNVSSELINLTVTAYLVLQGLAPSLWGPISDARGRRVAYIGTFCVFLGACVGLALCQNYASLVVLRALQSAGSASTIAIGSGVIGDVTTRENRGGFMGIFQAGLLVPVAIGPVIGGALAGSPSLGGWRSVFWFLTIYSGVFLVFLILVLPETLRAMVGNGGCAMQELNVFSRFPLRVYQKRTTALWTRPTPSLSSSAQQKARPALSIDVFGPLRILVSKQAGPVIFFVAIYYAVWQMCITAMSTLFQSQYGLSETHTGLTYIANGVGSVVGTLVTGKLLDRDYKRAAAAAGTGPFPLEKARMRLLPLFAVLQSASILMFGWTIDRNVAIAAPIVSTFITGWCVVSMAGIVSTYLVDVHGGGGAATASLNLARCLLAAGGTSFVMPLIGRIGTGPAFSLCAGVQLLSSVGLVVQWRYGPRWRQEAEAKAKAKQQQDTETENEEPLQAGQEK
ncbi:mfs transporter [Ophiostoma piceae UAMH 11346]|uniref:Mfs transporter n=1 Tax=Ophiostoma piceae (strain UAMH 11346) TaxID=1262450 RepID=S3C6F4_OPHP1|nr:mfs transporter [Ophiostoma piceae UAMH 11346]